jgi:hypothetical protein
MRTWGCRAYIYLKAGVDNKVSEKIKARATISYLIGYKGYYGHIYRVYLPDKDRVICVRDIKFDKLTLSTNIRIQRIRDIKATTEFDNKAIKIDILELIITFETKTNLQDKAEIDKIETTNTVTPYP